MKIFLFTVISFLVTAASIFSSDLENRWGQIGHYVTGQIAENHITETTAAEIKRVIGNESIAAATVWMDDIRPDSAYDYTNTWHWVTIPDGMTYEESEKNPEGDIIGALEKCITALKEGGLSEQEEYEYLKFVMHLIGDIHQPLHVGTGEDLGGNRVRVQWMGDNSNLHRVWDSDMINSRQMSYTEMAMNLDVINDEKVKEWQSSTVRDWAKESMSYREDVYDLPDNHRLGYEYRFQNYDIVQKRLVQAGVRLAGVLNDIYDN